MTKKPRARKGEGRIEQLPSGHWRAVHCRCTGGVRSRFTRTFKTEDEAKVWLDDQRGDICLRVFASASKSELESIVVSDQSSPMNRRRALDELIRRSQAKKPGKASAENPHPEEGHDR